MTLYKKFMTHAKKVTRNAEKVNPAKKVLRGVFHRQNGSLVVTDSHRLYMLMGAYEGEETVINPVTNTRINDKYPEVDRLFPYNNHGFSSSLNVDEFLKATDVVNVADPVMKYEGNNLYCSDPGTLRAKYTVSVTLPKEYTFRSDAGYWIDALRMFKAFKYTEVRFDFQGAMRPFTLTSPDERLIALLLPVRVF